MQNIIGKIKDSQAGSNIQAGADDKLLYFFDLA